MNIRALSHSELKENLHQLMDSVALSLKAEPNVDHFLDSTLIFDEWEAVLPEAEYPIFMLAVLNNIRRESIVQTIISSILDDKVNFKSAQETNKTFDTSTGHPFC